MRAPCIGFMQPYLALLIKMEVLRDAFYLGVTVASQNTEMVPSVRNCLKKGYC